MALLSSALALYLLLPLSYGSPKACPSMVDLRPLFSSVPHYSQTVGNCYAVAGAAMATFWLRNIKSPPSTIGYVSPAEVSSLFSRETVRRYCDSSKLFPGEAVAQLSSKKYSDFVDEWWQCESEFRLISGGRPELALDALVRNGAVCEGKAFEKNYEPHRAVYESVDALLTTYHDLSMVDSDLSTEIWPECEKKADEKVRLAMKARRFYRQTLLDEEAGTVRSRCRPGKENSFECEQGYDPEVARRRGDYLRTRYALECFNEVRLRRTMNRFDAGDCSECERYRSQPLDGAVLNKLLNAAEKAAYALVHSEVLPEAECPKKDQVSVSDMSFRTFGGLGRGRPLDRELCDQGRPLLITFCSGALQGKSSCDAHVSVVVGRRMKEGQVQYLIRNSWGGGCEVYVKGLRKRCENGDVWLSVAELEGIAQEHNFKISLTRFK